MNLVNGLYSHPKIMKAVAMLQGQMTHNDVFTFYVLGLAYAHQHLTDGYLPQEAVENLWKTCGGQNRNGVEPKQKPITNGLDIAKVFSNRAVRLWHSRPGGYAIHDYLKHNPSASTVKTKRERDRVRQAAYRGQSHS